MFRFSRIFSPKSAPPVDIQSFPYPITPCPRMAIFPPYFAPEELPLAGVSTLAAPIETIRAIDPGVWSPEFPVVVFSRLGDALLSEEDRNFVWRTFGVPVFEYLLDENGRIIASECEAHEGLHFDRSPTFWKSEIIEESCPCGAPGSRLKWVDAIIVENEPNADVAKLADAPDLGSGSGNRV
jgi:hypothetical protein